MVVEIGDEVVEAGGSDLNLSKSGGGFEQPG